MFLIILVLPTVAKEIAESIIVRECYLDISVRDTCSKDSSFAIGHNKLFNFSNYKLNCTLQGEGVVCDECGMDGNCDGKCSSGESCFTYDFEKGVSTWDSYRKRIFEVTDIK